MRLSYRGFETATQVPLSLELRSRCVRPFRKCKARLDNTDLICGLSLARYHFLLKAYNHTSV